MVISDCRFPNEIKSIKNAGGIVIRVVRGPEPDWYDAALSANRGSNSNTTWATSKRILEQAKVHASETAWIGTRFDAVIDNNADGLDNLYGQIKDLVLNLQASKAGPSV